MVDHGQILTEWERTQHYMLLVTKKSENNCKIIVSYINFHITWLKVNIVNNDITNLGPDYFWMILTMVEHVLVVNIGQHGQWSKIKKRDYNEIHTIWIEFIACHRHYTWPKSQY